MADPQEPDNGIDLSAEIQQLRRRAGTEDHSSPDDQVRAELDSIAEAAEAGREGGRLPARRQVANRDGGVDSHRADRVGAADDDADGDGQPDDESAAPVAEAQRGTASSAAHGLFSASPEPAEPSSASPFLFSAADSGVEPGERLAVPSIGLLFQAPDPEQAILAPAAEEFDAEEDDDEEESPAPRSRGRRRSRDDRAEEEPQPDPDADDDGDLDDDQDLDDDSGEESGRKRRRRGGRGRRRRSREDGEDRDASEAAEESPSEPAESSREAEQPSDEGEGEQGSGSSRRRRRRRESTDRSDEVQSIKGSTRLEAKRQRRREGREQGRRRQSITEAEFLARRESVKREMIVRQQAERTQIAVLEDDVCVEHYMSESRQQTSLIGNVYLGKVQNVLPSMEAAFIDIGRGRNGVLYAGEVNWDLLGTKNEPRRIESALSSGATVLVQVTKDPVGHKGARLTSQISLPGRFLVFVPGSSMTGISRKLPDNERSRLKKILKEVLPEGSGVIVRTAAEGASEEDLRRDVERLRDRWASIQKKTEAPKVLAPELLYSEPDMTLRIVRDVFNEDFSGLVVQGDRAWGQISEYVEQMAPDLVDRMSHFTDDADVFDRHGVNEMISKAMNRKVNLPSGGSLVIDRTEAMTVIDVNTGKFTGSGGNLEQTVTLNNLEAAEEVIRQLRLRDIGGIIVIDFIDMVLEANRDLVVRRLVECLGRDRTRHQVAEVTSLGLVQMTRKRIGTGLAESFEAAGEDLSGRGLLLPAGEESPRQSGRGGRGKDRGRRERASGHGNGGGGAASPAAKADEHQPTVEASRQAVAAIAKATLKTESAEPEDAAVAQDSAAASEAPSAPEQRSGDEVGAATTGRSRRRGGRRRPKNQDLDTGSSEVGHGVTRQDTSTADAEQHTAPADEDRASVDRPGEETGTARASRSRRGSRRAAAESAIGAQEPATSPAPVATAPAAPSGPVPLMIGLGQETRVQEAPKPQRAARQRAEKRAEKLAPETPAAPPAPPVLMLGMSED